jgi:hypothetical protein
VIIPGNPAPLVKTSLMTYLGSDARVVRDVPDLWKPADGPVVLVADDGGPLKWPIMSRIVIRVTVFANGKDTARLLAGRCIGHLQENRISGLVVFRSGTSILEARDPKTGADMASFTVPTTVRTVEIA